MPELLAAHEAHLEEVTRHSLLHAAGLPTAGIITATLGLALSLRREVVSARRAGVTTGRATAHAVKASRRQFALLMRALEQQPLAPKAVLVLQDVAWGRTIEAESETVLVDTLVERRGGAGRAPYGYV